jgi:hypothetical protein
MICPNCHNAIADDVSYCVYCGAQFPQVTPIPPVQPQVTEQLPPVYTQPVIIERDSGKSWKYVALVTALVTLPVSLLIGYLILRSLQPKNPPPLANNRPLVKTPTPAPKPTPTPYEDWKNQVAPEEKRTLLIDDQFEVAANEHRGISFNIETENGRLVGGFRVTKGPDINFFVYPADAYEQYPTNGLKPVHLEGSRNKKLNERLPKGDYVLVFENAEENNPVEIAAELFLVEE